MAPGLTKSSDIKRIQSSDNLKNFSVPRSRPSSSKISNHKNISPAESPALTMK